MAGKTKEGTQHELRTVFDVLGGVEGCRRLSAAFHDLIEHEPGVRAMFPKSMNALAGHFALFLEERFGGSSVYTRKRGKQSLLCRHAHLTLSTAEAQTWLRSMSAALDSVGLNGPEREAALDFFAKTAESLTDPFSPYYDLNLDELAAELDRLPGLVGQSPMGHSLLRTACSRWEVAKVQLLLARGADPRVREPLGHGLLYRVANSGGGIDELQACEIVRMLAARDAEVNLHSGPGKNTPLHMAARRGHVGIAKALIERGAHLEAKDTKGETPLRRAVNCNNAEVARVLIEAAADPQTMDKQGRSAMEFVRSESMKSVFTLALR